MNADPLRIPLAPPNIGDAERDLVNQALRTPDIAYGPVVSAFEAAVAEALGRRHAIALITGTAALHLALLAVGVQPDDEVLLPTLTFIAPANAVRYVGAHPILFDVEPHYRQLDIERLRLWLADSCVATSSGAVNHSTRRRIAALIAVDLLGHPSDIPALREVLAPYGIPIIDDAAEALGARAHDRPIGTGADIVCLSFNANKIVTAGGGGMLLCDGDDVALHVRHLASQAKEPGDAYDHARIGFNYRLPAAAAALGLGQFRRLPAFVAKKRAIAARYRNALRDVPGLQLPQQAVWAQSTDWLYTLHVDDDLALDAPALRRELDARSIDTRPLFTPLHRTGAHQHAEAHQCPVAERLHRTAVMLPSSTLLTEDDQDRVIDAIREIVLAVRPAPAPQP